MFGRMRVVFYRSTDPWDPFYFVVNFLGKLVATDIGRVKCWICTERLGQNEVLDRGRETDGYYTPYEDDNNNNTYNNDVRVWVGVLLLSAVPPSCPPTGAIGGDYDGNGQELWQRNPLRVCPHHHEAREREQPPVHGGQHPGQVTLA